MNDLDKLFQLAEWMRFASLYGCRFHGGYPDDVQVIGGRCIVAATESNGRPSLRITSAENAVRWHDAIAAELNRKLSPEEMEEYDDEEHRLWQVINESDPEEIDYQAEVNA
jgi:hypothetical protein